VDQCLGKLVPPLPTYKTDGHDRNLTQNFVCLRDNFDTCSSLRVYITSSKHHSNRRYRPQPHIEKQKGLYPKGEIFLKSNAYIYVCPKISNSGAIYFFSSAEDILLFWDFFRLTNILGNNTFRKARSRSAGQEISNFLRKPQIHYRVHKSKSLVKTVRTSRPLPPFLLNIRTFELASSLLSFTIQILHAFSHLPMRSTCPAYLANLNFIFLLV
jgi:hypothetical protein